MDRVRALATIIVLTLIAFVAAPVGLLLVAISGAIEGGIDTGREQWAASVDNVRRHRPLFRALWRVVRTGRFPS